MIPFQCSSYCTSAHVGRISVGKNANIDFIYQFVKHNMYNYDCKWRKNCYLTGTPTKFPNYGDFPRTFFVVCIFLSIIYNYFVIIATLCYKIFTFFYFSIQRNYGIDISISPWQDAADDIDHISQIDDFKFNNNHIGM